jgi:hypothetical protein
VSFSGRRNNVVAERVQERRRREDSAQRLTAAVPSLVSLNLEIAERASEVGSETVYIRRVVVNAAPALFEVPCGETSCEDGGHDITNALLGALREGLTSFSGEDACHGSVRTSRCSRIVRYTATATYRLPE